MGVPIEITPVIVSVEGPTVIELDWAHRSVISKLVVLQLEGVGEAFTVALYNHVQVQDGQQVSDSEGDDVGKIPDDCFRVSTDLAATNGKLLYFSENTSGGYGFVFFSHTVDPKRQGQRSSKLYLKITPVTGTRRRFAVAVGGMKEVE